MGWGASRGAEVVAAAADATTRLPQRPLAPRCDVPPLPLVTVLVLLQILLQGACERRVSMLSDRALLLYLHIELGTQRKSEQDLLLLPLLHGSDWGWWMGVGDETHRL